MTGRPPPGDRVDSDSHRPAQPSSLRQSHTPSRSSAGGSSAGSISSRADEPAFASESTPLIHRHGSLHGNNDDHDHDDDDENIGSGLTRSHSRTHPAHPGVCTHGTFSPRPSSPADGVLGGALSDDDADSGTGTTFKALDSAISNIVGSDEWKKWGWLKQSIRTRKMGHSRELAEQAGFRDTPLMYLAYYVPCINWMRQYKAAYIKGDLVAALTVASFYLPMALSLASNLAHVPPINGLYSFVFNPFLYALLGSSPQMVVGPEAAGSLLVGSVIEHSIRERDGVYDEDVLHAQICGVVAGLAGATVLIAGLARLGFLDSVLSRPFLRGFISAIGFVIAVDQLVPELGLAALADEMDVLHGSSVEKIGFILENIERTHMLTFIVAAVSFVIIMVCRELKRRLEPRFPSVVFIPDRFLVVVASAIICQQLRLDEQGVEVLGTVRAANGNLFAFRFPFQAANMPQIRSAMATSFIIALLGFFESSVAAKSLGGGNDAIQGIELSANREMLALGVANLVGACFMSLPAFGGYGRSKVNKTTGGKTPMSSIFLSLITLCSILVLLPYFYYLPKPVLSSMISVVAWSLIEEAPHDISFFIRIRGWKELSLMAIIFFSTIFYSLTLGMALGVGISILLVLKHSTRPRIQILGRIPGTDRFENAEAQDSSLEFVEGCLIVKIPEPLTFANTGELKARLRRLELYGTSDAHPALPRLRSHEANRNIVFDIHGVTSMDGSGTQVLEEIVRGYRDRGVRVFISRGPSRKNHPVWRQMEMSGIVDLVGPRHFTSDVGEALRWTEYEDSVYTGSVDER